MPQALRVLKALQGQHFSDSQAMGVATAISMARVDGSIYSAEDVANCLFDGGFTAEIAETIAEAVSYCFETSRFRRSYQATVEKTGLVRAGLPAIAAQLLLDTIDACVVAPRGKEVREPIAHPPSPGQVVMCDFTYLQKPEMQKIRRAIVISKRMSQVNGRCTVVPVSMTEAHNPSPHHLEFQPGTYPFFHSTEAVWAVCDHVYTVSLVRLWKVNVQKRPILPSISAQHLAEIRTRLGSSLGV